MVCKIAFCSEFLDIPDNAEERGEGEEGEEHRQLQSVMRVTQMQTKKKKKWGYLNYCTKYWFLSTKIKIYEANYEKTNDWQNRNLEVTMQNIF